MVGLPSKKILADTTILVLKRTTDPIKASEINDLVAAELNIPANILAIEDANCTGTEYSYQMRWVRTSLKNKGVISNPKRGYWMIVKD